MNVPYHIITCVACNECMIAMLTGYDLRGQTLSVKSAVPVAPRTAA